MSASKFSKLCLFLIVGTMPSVMQWLVLTYDTTTRGLLILGGTVLMQGAITAKAFLENDTDTMAKLIAAAEKSINGHRPGTQATATAEESVTVTKTNPPTA